jgi:ABC-2 type transport system permease protein
MELLTKQLSSKLKVSWPTLKAAAWLGWQIESNWTDPFLFAIYSIVKPISGAAILIVMYSIISGKDFSSPMFAFIYLGNAFFMLVGAVVQGVSWGIMDDREHYRTLKYLYIAPIRMPVYLIGRSAANFITRLFSVIITLLFGVIFLKLPLDLARVDWPLFLVAFILGFIVMADMGLILGGWTLIIKRNAWSLGDSVGAAMFIFSGAIFPLSVLPKPLQVIGYIIPISYWLTLIRRAMIPEVANAYPMFAELSNLQLIAILGAAAVIFSIIAVFSFKYFDYLARERGNIDMVSNY